MSDQYQYIKVTGEDREKYRLRQLARTCVEIARLERRLDRLTTVLWKHEPTIVYREFQSWLSYELDGATFLAIHQSQPVCKLPTRTERHAFCVDGNKPWYLRSTTQPEPGWVKLSLSLSDEEWLHWAGKALAYARNSTRNSSDLNYCYAVRQHLKS